MADVKALLFDLGGTVYDCSEHDKEYSRMLYQLLAEDNGISLDEAKTLLEVTMKKLESESPIHITKVATMKALGYSRDRVHEAFCMVDPIDFLSPMPGLSDLFERLSEKYKLGVLTNFRRTQAEKILGTLGVDIGIFNLIISEDYHLPIKPDPAPFNLALDLFDIEPRDCVYIGDSPTKDMVPAKKVGMRTILVGDIKDKNDSTDTVIRGLERLEEALESL